MRTFPAIPLALSPTTYMRPATLQPTWRQDGWIMTFMDTEPLQWCDGDQNLMTSDSPGLNSSQLLLYLCFDFHTIYSSLMKDMGSCECSFLRFLWNGQYKKTQNFITSLPIPLCTGKRQCIRKLTLTSCPDCPIPVDFVFQTLLILPVQRQNNGIHFA